jgi:hypothetical protein
MKRIIPILAAAVLSAFVFSACVKDEEPIFEKSASLRVKEAMDNAQKVLTSAANGWKMYYYPHPDQNYGGYMYALQFDNESVTVWSELFTGSSTSLYKMTNDDGPVLSFDTDNYAFHFFATPSGSTKNLYGVSGLYQAYKGDFEFIVMSAKPDEVILKGKRSGNKIYMYPLDEEPGAFIDKAARNSDDIFVSSFAGTIGGEAATAYLDLSYRWITLTLTGEQYAESEDASVDAPYMVTDTGVRFYEPVKVGSYTLEALDWDNNTQSLVSVSGDPVSVALKGQLPPGWRAYNDLLGDYDLVYNDSGEAYYSAPRTVRVSLVEDEYKKSMLLKGVNDLYDLKVQYDLSSGNIFIMGQIIGTWEPNGNSIYWAACYARSNAAGTGVTWSGWRSTNYGMKGYVDDDLSAEAGTNVFKFTTGPCASAAQPITGFALIMQTPAGASGGWMSSDTYKDWFPFNYRYYAHFWVTMTKVK